MKVVRYLPIIITGWHLVTVVISYTVSTHNGHVYYKFPYISDTGAIPPESNVFGQCLNIGALLMAIGIYVRFKQVDDDIQMKIISLNPRCNTIGLVLGYTACLGESIVGNFQELTLGTVHLIGTLMAFGIGTFYLYVQTWISTYYLNACERNITPFILLARITLAAPLLPLIFTVVYFGYEALLQFNGETLLWWTKEDGGYSYHLVSAISEWIMYLFIFVYISTFFIEFKHIELKSTVDPRYNAHGGRDSIQSL